MLTKILMVMPIVVAVFAGIVALQSSEFRVARTAKMRAQARYLRRSMIFINGKHGTHGGNWIRR